MLITNKFYKSIEEDTNLRKPERELWRKLCAIWIYNGCKNLELIRTPEVMLTRNKKVTVTIGHKTLAKKLSYARADYLTHSIKSLVAKGYMTYTPGTGISGQAKNISRLSRFYLNIPQIYELPFIKKIDEATKERYTHSNMVALGVTADEASLILKSAQIKKATDTAKHTHSLNSWAKVQQLKKSLEALNLKAAA